MPSLGRVVGMLSAFGVFALAAPVVAMARARAAPVAAARMETARRVSRAVAARATTQ